jgi:hypothetical protein
MLFIFFNSNVRYLWQLKSIVFLHGCLIRAVLLHTILKWSILKIERKLTAKFLSWVNTRLGHFNLPSGVVLRRFLSPARQLRGWEFQLLKTAAWLRWTCWPAGVRQWWCEETNRCEEAEIIQTARIIVIVVLTKGVWHSAWHQDATLSITVLDTELLCSHLCCVSQTRPLCWLS